MPISLGGSRSGTRKPGWDGSALSANGSCALPRKPPACPLGRLPPPRPISSGSTTNGGQVGLAALRGS